MIRSNLLVVGVLSAGLGAVGMGIVQTVRLTSPASAATVQRMDDDDRYPHMRKALHLLHDAKDALQDAEPRFKGHRDRAIDHVDQAIKQCEDALSEG